MLVLLTSKQLIAPTNRLVTLIAEDNAIEDTIYHLHRALNAGRIDLERFLRVLFFLLFLALSQR